MKKVGIAGVGGIGSNVAVHLVRSGHLNLKIVDYDVIEESNLNRQFYFYDQIGNIKVDELFCNLHRINSDVKIDVVNKLLYEANLYDTFNDCDIIVEGFDDVQFKTLLIETFANSKKTIICSNGVAGLDIDEIKTKKLQDNINIVGDFKTDISEKKTFSPKIMIVASIMANIVLKELGYTDKI